MRTYDLSPLFRSTIGFDRLFDLAETAQRGAEEGYPPYNIERLAEDRYQITLAVAGFSPDEISITAEQNVVTIEGGKTEKAEREFLYRGISTPTSSASSTSPTTFRSRMQPSTTACSRSNWSGKSPKP
jgi:molecular chaperone IbpA